MARDWLSFLDFRLLPQGTFERRHLDSQRRLSTLSLPRTATTSSTTSQHSVRQPHRNRSPSLSPVASSQASSLFSSRHERQVRHSIDGGSSRPLEVIHDLRRVRTESADGRREDTGRSRSLFRWTDHRDGRGRSHSRASSRQSRQRSETRGSSHQRSLSQRRGMDSNDRLTLPVARNRSISPGPRWHEDEVAEEEEDDDEEEMAAGVGTGRPRVRYSNNRAAARAAAQDVQTPNNNIHFHSSQQNPLLPTSTIPSPPASRSWYRRCSELFSRRSSFASPDASTSHPPLEVEGEDEGEEEPPRPSFNLPRAPGPIDMAPRVSRRRLVDEGLGDGDTEGNQLHPNSMHDADAPFDSSSHITTGTSNTNDASSFYMDPPPLSVANTRDNTFILQSEMSAAERAIMQKIEIIKRLAFVVCTLPIVLALALYYQAQTLFWWLFLLPVGGILLIIFYRRVLIRRLHELRIQSLSRTSTLQSNYFNASRMNVPTEVVIAVEDEIPPPPPTYQASLQMPPAYLSQLLRKVPSYSSISSRLGRSGSTGTAQRYQDQLELQQPQPQPVSPTSPTSSLMQAPWGSSTGTLTTTSAIEQTQQQQPGSDSVSITVEMVQTNQGASSLARTVMDGQREAEAGRETPEQTATIDRSSTSSTQQV